ncbi:MAG TPA: acyl-CoA dehydrogenase family protein [Sphingobium sp.]
MEFAFTEDQIAITEAARDMLVDTCTPAALRKLLEAETGTGRDEDRWSTIRDMGLLGILAPESAGGLGMGLPDFIGVAEAAGYVALPEPLVEQAGIVVPLLAEIGQDIALAKVLTGRTIAVGAPGRRFVTDADQAEKLLLAHGDAVHLLDAKDVVLTRQEGFDPFRRLFRVDWTPSDATRVASSWGQALDRGAVLAAAQLIGLAQRSIDMAVAYAKDRTQFGKPIGSYQAVKHLIATAQVKVEFARPVVHAAAAELALGTLASQARVSHAKIAAGDAADLAARTAVQVHGAMGMTWEVDLHFFLKRALGLRADWGTSALHRARVAQRIGALPTGPALTFASELAAL